MKEIIYCEVNNDDAYNWFRLNIDVWRDAYKDIFPEEAFSKREEELEDRVIKFRETVHNNNEIITYVAECDGKIIGMMLGLINSQNKFFIDGYADLSVLYVDRNYQNMKVGTNLKDIFVKWAKENHAKKFVIGVLKDNTKARKVYESWGGKLSEHEGDFMLYGVPYKEVFYTYNL